MESEIIISLLALITGLTTLVKTDLMSLKKKVDEINSSVRTNKIRSLNNKKIIKKIIKKVKI